MSAGDPFRHHPGLRGRIADPETSYFRTFHPSMFDAKMAAQGFSADWRRCDAEIAASCAVTLAARPDPDLWVFAYGSLIWDPAFRFEEVRRATLPSHARRMILRDVLGGRGTVAEPGLMAALDAGPGCHGVAFRIPVDRVETEARVIWNREYCVRAYKPEFLTAGTAAGPVAVLAFVADHAADQIDPGISRADQVRFAATGQGTLGTSLEYLENLVDRLGAIGIEDTDLTGLLREVRAAVV